MRTFDRLKVGVRLTEAGKSFLDEARRLLSDLNVGVDRTRLAQARSGRLRWILRNRYARWGGNCPLSAPLPRRLAGRATRALPEHLHFSR